MTHSHLQRGYTLVELVVSVAIFSVVMLVAGAAFLTLINLDRQARATSDVVTNLSYVVESMERSIRTGTDYDCGGTGDCWPTGRDSFSFTDAEGRSVSYALAVNGTSGQVQQCIESTCMVLTDPRIDVENLIFYARGTTPGDDVQPTVVFTVRGILRPDARSEPVEFILESGATQRVIDL